jgi:hypothetical protein
MYSDKCLFDTSARGTTWVTRLRRERYHDHCIDHDFQSGRASAMVWGAISYNRKSSSIFFLDGTGKSGVLASDYLEQVLEPECRF